MSRLQKVLSFYPDSTVDLPVAITIYLSHTSISRQLSDVVYRAVQFPLGIHLFTAS